MLTVCFDWSMSLDAYTFCEQDGSGFGKLRGDSREHWHHDDKRDNCSTADYSQTNHHDRSYLQGGVK